MTPYANDPSDAILPISHCRLTPQGVTSVMHHLGQHTLFTDMPEERLRAMAFAFLAHGGTSDNNHIIDPNSFHYMHYEANRESRRGSWRNNMCESYLTLVMDMLTWLDRLSGGATVFMHSPGTHMAGTWAITEEALVETFLPTVLLREKPSLRAVCAQLVQYFAQYVATPAMERWDRVKGVHVVGPLDDAGVPCASLNGGHALPLIPVSASPRHQFYGRRAGVVDFLIAAEGLDPLPPPTAPLVSPTSPSQSPYMMPPAQAPFVKQDPEGVAFCQRTTKLESLGKPSSIHSAADDSWTEDDATVWMNLPIPEIAPSNSVSRQVSGFDSGARHEVTYVELGPDEIVSDLLFRIQELERVAMLREAEIVRLRVRDAAGSDDHHREDPLHIPSSSRPDNLQESESSEAGPPVDHKGKAPARDSSPGPSLVPTPSMPPSPSSTVCDLPPSQPMVVSPPTLAPLSSVSHYTSGHMHVIGSKSGLQSAPLRLTPPAPMADVKPAENPSPTPPTLPPSLSYSPTFPFGPATDHLIRFFKLSTRTHGHLRRIQQDYARVDWSIGLGVYLREASDAVINELAAAMRQDCPLT